MVVVVRNTNPRITPKAKTTCCWQNTPHSDCRKLGTGQHDEAVTAITARGVLLIKSPDPNSVRYYVRDWYRLVGLVVKASTSRAEGPGFESRWRRDFFGVESYQ